MDGRFSKVKHVFKLALGIRCNSGNISGVGMCL